MVLITIFVSIKTENVMVTHPLKLKNQVSVLFGVSYVMINNTLSSYRKWTGRKVKLNLTPNALNSTRLPEKSLEHVPTSSCL